jgi:dienelactone hydrolase
MSGPKGLQVNSWLQGATSLFLSLALSCHASAAEVKSGPTEVRPREILVVQSVSSTGRSLIHRDPVEAALVSGTWTIPHAGDEVRTSDGTVHRWESLRAGDDGSFPVPGRAGYAYLAVPVPEEQILILEAAGQALVYVNGEPRAGDPYGTGYLHLPVKLHRGTNDFLFATGRGNRLRVRLVPPEASVAFDLADATLPDLLVDKPADTWAGVVITNATSRPQDGLLVETRLANGEAVRHKLPSLEPLSTRKDPIRIRGPASGQEGKAKLELRILQDGQEIDRGSLTLEVRKSEQAHKITFRSKIDDSVQYYALVPATREPGRTAEPKRPGLVLTLHGAGVEAIGQAACYAPKSWAHIVAPTNRRPYGFDWEDWGRLDAFEVLDLARLRLHPDPHRIYVTGHSMGGHGVWHLGATYPGTFAAIAPSAGWISMWTYAGVRRPERPDPVEEMLLRAAAPSDTLALIHNLASEGIYVLHGDKDDNVPVSQARTMKDRLAGWHQDFAYHEQPGAGHWWGNACVDWPPLFDFLARHALPDADGVRSIDFTTMNPGVSDSDAWIHIETQVHPFRPSRVQAEYDPSRRRIRIRTQNVARLSLAPFLFDSEKPSDVELDDQPFLAVRPAGPRTARAWFERASDRWSLVGAPAAAGKGRHRNGPFKDAFNHHVQLVYGTHGTPEENAWAFARARFDAETFWYRGNGSLDVLADTAFQPTAEPNRNVVLYGHADSNAAWSALLARSPVQVHRGRLQIADRQLEESNLACLFVRPRPGSDTASVGIVSGTGLAGLRLTDRLPYFVSGTGFPDCVVLGPELLTEGVRGVRAAGFFGNDWGVAKGEFAWRK